MLLHVHGAKSSVCLPPLPLPALRLLQPTDCHCVSPFFLAPKVAGQQISCFLDARRSDPVRTLSCRGIELRHSSCPNLEPDTKTLEPPESLLTDSRLSHLYLIRRHGWRVRRLHTDDVEVLKQVANIQAQAFHERSIAFDDLFFFLFKAEVLSSLLYKTRRSPPNRYACLVAEADLLELSEVKMVGAVDVTALAEKNILKNLPGAEEYLYVSGIAVDHMYRRQKVATALLQACDLTAAQWGFQFLVLQAYETDVAARSLYSKAGYKVISKDPPWLSTWLGRRQRVVLAKRAGIDFQDTSNEAF